jgi:signal transduction histidine kinase
MSEERVHFKVHPRVFSALGSELVTDEIVALIELVKNSYDAFASRAIVQIGHNEELGQYISIIDNGSGMNRKTIEDVWFTLATPNKLLNTNAEKDTKKRRVTGEKGLGRFASAKLGSKFEMITKAVQSQAWKVTVDWDEVVTSEDMSKCSAMIEDYNDALPFEDENSTGTAILIYKLGINWEFNMLDDLRDSLSRLVSPFNKDQEFELLFCTRDEQVDFNIAGEDADNLRVKSEQFLLEPKYKVHGYVLENGTYQGSYEYRPIGELAPKRIIDFEKPWSRIYKEITTVKDKTSLSSDEYTCGGFKFEIRAWDISADDIEEISQHYNILGKRKVRKAIASHKGISVYRDSILMLPKTDNARDWLKLDLRRISSVGHRVSTSQIIGYVSVTADDNPLIVDSSDREKFQKNRASIEFEAILISIVRELEQMREIDRSTPENKPFKELFKSLDLEEFTSDIAHQVEDGLAAKDLLPLLYERAATQQNTVNIIQKRLVYYSRLATVGSIASMLVHEIRNRTTSIGYFLNKVTSVLCPMPSNLDGIYNNSLLSIKCLEDLADRFLPLANRSYSSTNKYSDLKGSMIDNLAYHEDIIAKSNIKVTNNIPEGLNVAIGTAELATILFNVVANAIYWLHEVPKKYRELLISATPDYEKHMVELEISDTGPGINNEYLDRIFEPGITAKTNGIGMGLTVVAELLSEFNGSIYTTHPGNNGGATFNIELPLREDK